MMDTLSTLATFDDLRRCEFTLTDGIADLGELVLFII